MMKGQRSQVLIDRMKHDSKQNIVVEEENPIDSLKLTERTVHAQTNDQCPFATV